MNAEQELTLSLHVLVTGWPLMSDHADEDRLICTGFFKKNFQCEYICIL